MIAGIHDLGLDVAAVDDDGAEVRDRRRNNGRASDGVEWTGGLERLAGVASHEDHLRQGCAGLVDLHGQGHRRQERRAVWLELKRCQQWRVGEFCRNVGLADLDRSRIEARGRRTLWYPEDRLAAGRPDFEWEPRRAGGGRDGRGALWRRR